MRVSGWILICAGMLMACVGCRGSKGVKVSGAVAQPGEYAFRPGWSAQEYLEAAGGLLAEADVENASLVRALEDRVVTGEHAHGQVAWWSLAEAPDVRPGDEIAAPLRAYAMRWDTVRVVRDFEVVWNGKVYRVARGRLAPGWTERGVMAAVVLGNGRVFREGTDEVMGPFQYLYLRLHPDIYHRVFPETGDPVQDREALEDAVAVHGILFENSRYRSGENSTLPPAGYVRVLAGVWLTPRSGLVSIRGVRKKRYEDGRVWTTFPDGLQRMEYPDGRVKREFPEGGREICYPDGRVTYRDVLENERTTFPDGKVVVKDRQGNEQVRYSDGREVWKMVSGNRVTSYPDGRRVHEFASGTVRVVLANGTERTRFADGTRHVRYPDGKLEILVPGGAQEVRYPDGRVSAVTAEGHAVEVYPDGRQVTRMVDGTVVEAFPDGRKVQKMASGETLEVLADQTRHTVYKDGSELFRRPDGTRVAHLTDGTVVEEFPDGRRVQTDSVGNRLELFSDARAVLTDVEGNRIEAFPGGVVEKSYADLYRYRGLVRRELLEVDRVPERMSPGAMVQLRGRVREGVLDMSMAAFGLPDGEVLEFPVEMDRERFAAEVSIPAPGHYRLQVQGELADGKRAVLEDLALKVGSPPPLETPVLEIEPFPGPEAAAQRLVEMVNTSREKLGRPPLERDSALSDAAQRHLEEMLAYGYFSSWSPVSGAVDARLNGLKIPFKEVVDNLVRAPSVEEAHLQLMMSAGQRQHILDERWTHVGIAVAREQGEVWAVEIFIRR